jgi:hypothetical protein
LAMVCASSSRMRRFVCRRMTAQCCCRRHERGCKQAASDSSLFWSQRYVGTNTRCRKDRSIPGDAENGGQKPFKPSKIFQHLWLRALRSCLSILDAGRTCNSKPDIAKSIIGVTTVARGASCKAFKFKPRRTAEHA